MLTLLLCLLVFLAGVMFLWYARVEGPREFRRDRGTPQTDERESPSQNGYPPYHQSPKW